MKTYKWISCLLFATLSMAASLKAQNAEAAPYFKKGDVLLEFSGSYNHISYERQYTYDSKSDSLNFFYADVGGSYFFTNHISSGADTFWLYVPKVSGVTSLDEAGNESDVKATAIGLEWNVRYHFTVSRYFRPYVGVNAGYAWGEISGGGSDSDHLTTLGGHVGFIVPINDHVFFDTQIKYTDYDLPVNGLNLSTTRVLLGLKIRL